VKLRRAMGRWSAAVALTSAPPAWAAGGAHVVDDSEVETPGTCHLESWASRASDGGPLANLSPACTPGTLPRLEIGAGLQRTWGGDRDTLAGPTLKLQLRAPSDGPGVGLATSAAWSAHQRRLEAAGAILPVTVDVSERLRMNANLGWTYAAAAAHPHAAVAGLQAELRLARDLGLMTEVVERSHGRAGGQVGLRWTPGDGPLDIDLLAARRPDGVTPGVLTLGVTVRH